MFSIALPKWPASIIRGQAVSPKQAQEIILRLSTFAMDDWFSPNGRNISRVNILRRAFFMASWEDSYESRRYELNDDLVYRRWQFNIDRQRQHRLWYDGIGVLRFRDTANLLFETPEYLDLSSVVSTSYVYGCHGWMSWSGEINSFSTNLGKWPDPGQLYQEWELVAEAFPFLELRHQLCASETSEYSGPLAYRDEILAEYRVQDGQVEYVESDFSDLGLMKFPPEVAIGSRDSEIPGKELREAVIRLMRQNLGTKGALSMLRDLGTYPLDMFLKRDEVVEMLERYGINTP